MTGSARDADRALIFDLDGVLIDSEPLWRRAEIETFGEVGVELSEADCLETTGLRIDEVVAYWAARRPWSGTTGEDLAERIITRMETLIAREGEPMPGVAPALDRGEALGWRLGLASSSPMRLIDAVVRRFGLERRFACLCSAEVERRGKPHPDVYRSALRTLGLPGESSIAIEDSVNGLRSALAAGLRCVAVPPAEGREDPRFADATWRIDGLPALPSLLEEIEVEVARSVG